MSYNFVRKQIISFNKFKNYSGAGPTGDTGDTIRLSITSK